MLQQQVVKFYQIGTDDFRAIVLSSKGTCNYVCYLNSYGSYCTCLGFHYKGYCSHLKVFTKEITKLAEVRDNMETVNTPISIKGMNSVLQGGIPKGTLLGLYGSPQSGKTTTGIWSNFDLMKETGKNLLYIDTESGIATQFLPILVKRYNKRNGTDFGIKHSKIDFKTWLGTPTDNIPYRDITDTDKEQYIRVVDVPNIYQLLLFVGRPANIDLASNKPSLKLRNENLFQFIWESPMGKLLDGQLDGGDEYLGFVLDSFTNVMKIFGSETQNFPVRDTAQSIVLSQLSELLSENFEMYGTVIVHASKPPADVSAKPKPVGGKSVGHAFKYIVQFSSPKSKDLNTSVTILPYRLPTELGDLSGSTIIINNSGVF